MSAASLILSDLFGKIGIWRAKKKLVLLLALRAIAMIRIVLMELLGLFKIMPFAGTKTETNQKREKSKTCHASLINTYKRKATLESTDATNFSSHDLA